MDERYKEEATKQGRQLAAFLLSCEMEQRRLMLDELKKVLCFHCYEQLPVTGPCHCENDE